ncbi:MAG: helical backbone metal receptor [Wenzhouxiangella sp.]
MPTGSRVRGSGFGVRAVGGFRLLVLLMLMLGGAAAASGSETKPPRVIALAPHLAELAFAAGAGDTLVGTVAWSDYPAEAAALPVIGDAFRLDLERIMALNPDLALAWTGGTPASAARRLEDIDIDVVWIAIRTLDDIASSLVLLGDRLGQPARGRQAAKDYRSALSARPIPPGPATRTVFYQVSKRPLYTLGGRHILTELLPRCRARNLFADLDVEAAAVDYEAVLARQPQVILAGAEPGQADTLERWRRDRSLLPEGARLIEIDPDTLIRPTPRIIDGIDRLCRLLR